MNCVNGRSKNEILVLVDMQVDFVSGKLGSKMAVEIVPHVCKKLESYKEKKAFIIATLDTHDENYLKSLEGKYLPVEHCIKGSEGHKIDENLSKILPRNTVYVEKGAFGSFHLIDVIRKHMIDNNIEEHNLTIEAVGLCTDICVVSNAILLRSAFPNSKVLVDSACCAGTSKERHLATLEVLKSCQIDVF